MRLKIKNLKHIEEMSHGTMCFTATLYLDGKRIGTVENDGRGGVNRYHFPDRANRDLFMAYAKGWGEETGETFEPDAALVHAAITTFRHEKIARGMKRKGYPVTVVYDEDEVTQFVGLRSRANVPALLLEKGITEYVVLEP
jgi:hypothetical protein